MISSGVFNINSDLQMCLRTVLDVKEQSYANMRSPLLEKSYANMISPLLYKTRDSFELSYVYQIPLCCYQGMNQLKLVHLCLISLMLHHLELQNQLEPNRIVYLWNLPCRQRLIRLSDMKPILSIFINQVKSKILVYYDSQVEYLHHIFMHLVLNNYSDKSNQKETVQYRFSISSSICVVFEELRLTFLILAYQRFNIKRIFDA